MLDGLDGGVGRAGRRCGVGETKVWGLMGWVKRLPVCVLRDHVVAPHDVSDGEGGRARDAGQTVNQYTAISLPYLIYRKMTKKTSAKRHTTQNKTELIHSRKTCIYQSSAQFSFL